MLGFKKRSKTKKAEAQTSLALRLDNLIFQESAHSPKTPDGHSLPSPLSPAYSKDNLSHRSKLREKAEHHDTPLPENCFENRTPELAKRQFKSAVYANTKDADEKQWIETYGSDEGLPRNRLKPTTM